MRLWPRPHRSFIETSILVADSKQTLFLEFYLLHKTVQHSRLVPYQPRSRNNERSSSVTSGRHLDCTDNGIYIFASKLFILIDHTPYPAIVDFRSARWLPYVFKYRHALRAKHFGAPSVDGERARQLANTLLGTKDGGRHHQERASALTSLRRQIRCCALLATTKTPATKFKSTSQQNQRVND